MGSAFERLGQTQQGLLRQLQHAPDGVSVDELGNALGISRNAVRQHLHALLAQGLVARVATVRTGGRPGHRFGLTDAARELFPRRYVELASSLIAEIGATLGEHELQSLMARLGATVARDLAQRLAPRPPGERIGAIAAAMSELGYEATAETGGDAPEIRARNCVFHHLAQRHPAVCRFDLAFLAGASDQRVEHAECMVRGGRICRFRFRPGRGIDANA
jgi:predicted ArsR family transcriptional regulator